MSNKWATYQKSEHYQETARIHERRLCQLGFNPGERRRLMAAFRREIKRMLETGELVYVARIGAAYAKKD